MIVLGNGEKVTAWPLQECLKASPAVEDCVAFCPAQTRLVAVASPALAPGRTAAHGC